MGGSRLSRADLILISFAPLVLVFALDGYFRRPLYSYSLALYWIFDFFKFVVVPAGALVWLARRVRVVPSQYGMRRPAEHESWLHFIGLVAFLAFVLYLLYYVAFVASWIALRPPESTPFYKSIVPDGLLRVPTALYLAVTAGLVEEVFFRALPLTYLSERFPTRVPVAGYVLTTSLLFGVAHSGNGDHDVIATFIFGLFAAFFYLKLRDVWPLVGAHALIDLWHFA